MLAIREMRVAFVVMVAWVGIGCGGAEEFEPTLPDEASGNETPAGETPEERENGEEGGEETVEGAFPAMSSFSRGCSDENLSCETGEMCASAGAYGACLQAPTEETVLSNPYTAAVDPSESPNLDCVALYPEPSQSSSVTLYGIVDRFGSGLITENILIRVFDAALFTPWECDSLESNEKASCLADLVEDGSRILGETVSFGIEEEKGLACELDQDCPLGYGCTGEGLNDECVLNYGLYELENMPSNTPLVIMTRPYEEDDAGDWHTSYLFDAVFMEAFVDGEGRYRFDPLIVGHGQWKTVPSPFFTTIEPGNGAIGGRIRDCATPGGEGRRGWNLYAARVGFATPPSKFGYFNDKEDDSLPDASRTSTNILGRYTGLDVTPGPNVVSAALQLDGKNVSLGALPIYVFPDSLSVVSLPGRVATYTQE